MAMAGRRKASKQASDQDRSLYPQDTAALINALKCGPEPRSGFAISYEEAVALSAKLRRKRGAPRKVDYVALVKEFRQWMVDNPDLPDSEFARRCKGAKTKTEVDRWQEMLRRASRAILKSARNPK
jgi:hypothetical protein